MIVLDCSAAVNMVRETTEGNALKSLILTKEKIVSSELFFIEIANAFGKYVKAGIIDMALAVEYIREATCLVEEYAPISENYIEAFHQSIRLNHSIYDMLYLTLARRNGATLVTLDSKLIKLCETQGVDCVHQVGY